MPTPRSTRSCAAGCWNIYPTPTEDTLTGAMCSRLWHCRTYNRDELRRVCRECGLSWQREMWFSGLHRWLKLGGIIVELRRRTEPEV